MSVATTEKQKELGLAGTFTIEGARFANRVSRNNFEFKPKAMDGIAENGDGAPIYLDVHFQNGYSGSVGVAKNLKSFGTYGTYDMVLDLEHPWVKSIANRVLSGDKSLQDTIRSSVECDEKSNKMRYDPRTDTNYCEEVTAVRGFVIATKTGNTNGLHETEHRNQNNHTKPLETKEHEMTKETPNIETAGDIKKTWPKQVAELELAAKTEAEKSIAAEMTELKEKLEKAEKDLLVAQTELDSMNREKEQAEEEKVFEDKCDKIRCACTAAGAKEGAISETLVHKYAKLDDDELTQQYVSSFKKSGGTGLRDNPPEDTTSGDSWDEMFS